MTATTKGCLSKAAFLDRDGVVVRDTHYVHKVADFCFMPGAVEGLLMLGNLGYKLIIVTNQSGIGRNYFSEHDYRMFSNHMVNCLLARNVKLDGIYFCPHAPASALDACRCRKPAPGMLLTAANELNIAIDQSIMIGDRQSDMQAGRSAGVNECFLIADADDPEQSSDVQDARFPSLLETARFLSSRDS